MLLGGWFLAFQRIAVSSSLGSSCWTTLDPEDEGANFLKLAGATDTLTEHHRFITSMFCIALRKLHVK